MKVLIISHLPVATQNNMGKTFLSLFSRFSREELCQLYIYPAIPDTDRCASFYRVTDKEVVRSYLGKRRIGGEVCRRQITESQGLYEHKEDESFYRNRKNKSAFRRLARDAMWSLAPWYNKGLIRWLDEQKPTCIFVAPGVAKFLHNIALKIAKERNIPIITYICDEYYFVKEPSFGLDRLRLRLLKKKIDALMANSRHLVVICDELKEAYGEKFGLPVTTLMTGTNYTPAERISSVSQPRQIAYFGNIRCNRYLSLAQIGGELDAINKERGTQYKLKIYTSEKDPVFLEPLRAVESIELCGFIMGEEFDRVFHSAQLLLHAEAFDEVSIDFTQHSVSTKIADSLASGIPLLAYGPECISSMKHLIRNRCALIATSPQELRQMLLTAFEDEEARAAAARNGLAAAEKYHRTDRAGEKLREIISGISG